MPLHASVRAEAEGVEVGVLELELDRHGLARERGRRVQVPRHLEIRRIAADLLRDGQGAVRCPEHHLERARRGGGEVDEEVAPRVDELLREDMRGRLVVGVAREEAVQPQAVADELGGLVLPMKKPAVEIPVVEVFLKERK